MTPPPIALTEVLPPPSNGATLHTQSIPAPRPYIPGEESLSPSPEPQTPADAGSSLEQASALLRESKVITEAAKMAVEQAEKDVELAETQVKNDKKGLSKDDSAVAELMNGPAGLRIHVLRTWRENEEKADEAVLKALKEDRKAQREANEMMKEAKKKTLGYLASKGILRVNTQSSMALAMAVKSVCSQCSLK